MIVAVRASDGGLLCADKREIVMGAGRSAVKTDQIVKLRVVGHKAVLATVGTFKYSDGGFGTSVIFDAGAVVEKVLNQAGQTEELLERAGVELSRTYDRVLSNMSATSLPKLTEDREFFSVLVLYPEGNTTKLAKIVAKSNDARRATVQVEPGEGWFAAQKPLLIAPHTRLNDGTRASVVDVLSDYDVVYRGILAGVRSSHGEALAAAAVGVTRKLIILTGMTLDDLYGEDLANAVISPACDCAFVGRDGSIVFPYPSQ